MSGARKVYIKSFGCQMNVYDSHRMADTLAPEGYAETTTPEDADLVMGPTPKHRWAYACSKAIDEFLALAYWKERKLPVIIVRFFNTVGPRQSGQYGMVIPNFVRQALAGEPITVFGDGMQVRGNTFVTDCVAATTAAVQAPVGETYNLGGGESASVWDILKRLETITGRSAQVRREPPRPGDQRYTFADTGKLLRHLGWRPHCTLDEGLAQQVAWHRRHA